MKRCLPVISRIIIGLLFVFSGFVKSVDPQGSAIKFGEYFIAFKVEWLSDFAIYMAVLLSSIELILGIALLFGFYKKISAWLAVVFLTFFSLLTIVIFFINPVEDCGCFGDAIKLSNGETLIKNIIAIIISIPFIVSVKTMNWINRDIKIFTKFVAIVAGASFIPIYAIFYLPFIDFLPYKIGVNIPQAMTIPIGAEQDQYKTTLIYKNIADGSKKEFSLEDTTWHDNTKWEYIDTKTELIKRGFTPEISSFNILDREKNDVTQRLLSQKHIALFVINDKNISPNISENLKESILYCDQHRITPIFVTRHNIIWLTNIICKLTDRTDFEVYNADETLLKSIIRAKFGIIELENGTIISKHNLNHPITQKRY